MSENAFTGVLLKVGTRLDCCVFPTVGLWQTAQPTALNNWPPLVIDCAETRCPLSTTAPGFGGARRRMKLANAETSSITAGAGVWCGFDASSGYPLPPRPKQLAGRPKTCSSSGVGRSCVNSRLLMPISTLYASPAKICSDLFCAFQPNREMVPSLPLLLKSPLIPRLLF